jgi:hypothetical protein
MFAPSGVLHDHLIVSFAATIRTVTVITAAEVNSPISDRERAGKHGPPPKENALSIRASLQTWKRVAALLVAAAILLAAPYGVAVAVRSLA